MNASGVRWLPVTGFEQEYEVSEYGDVRKRRTGNVRLPAISNAGYKTFVLHRGAEHRHLGAHRLVALAFLGPAPSPKHVVAHWDGDKLNNHVSNLRWATYLENHLDKRRHGTFQEGERHYNSRFSDVEIRLVAHLAECGISQSKLSRLMGASKGFVRDIVLGKSRASAFR